MYQTPKFPRVIVSEKRHSQLHKEATKEGISMEQLAETKFKLADKVLKQLKKDGASSK
jgi:hypothetical protein